MRKRRVIAAMLFASCLGGCASPIDPALVKQRQIQLQRMQTRVFDAGDDKAVARGVIATLQDLNFIIVKTDTERGTISAKKYGDYPIEITVTIQTLPEKQISVHGDARYDSKTIDDPATYQEFFSSLQKSLFLSARAVD